MSKVNLKVIKEPDDKLCTRVSIGGSEEIGGYYCTYRGDIGKVKRILKLVVEELLKRDDLV